MHTRTRRMNKRYGMEVSDTLIRRVWAAVTRTPQASVRELAGELEMGFGTVATALRFLRDCGYIRHQHRACRARTIVIPFVLIGEDHARATPRP